jgi:hypothetical protein
MVQKYDASTHTNPVSVKYIVTELLNFIKEDANLEQC